MSDQHDSPEINAAFCTVTDIAPHWPKELEPCTEQALTRRSHNGSFPEFARLVNKRSVAIWNRQSVSDWFAERFSVTHPEIIPAMLKSKFPRPQVDVNALKMEAMEKRRKATNAKIQKTMKEKAAAKNAAKAKEPQP